jgi:hypothetical protein
VKRFLGLLCSVAFAVSGATALEPAASAAPATPVPSSLAIKHATAPLIATYGKHVVAVVRKIANDDDSGPLVAYEGTAGRHGTKWGRPTRLIPKKAPYDVGGAYGEPGTQFALARNGEGAIAWVRWVTAKRKSTWSVVVRLHHADGSWGRSRIIPGAERVAGLAVNGRGEVVVAADAQHSGRTKMLAYVGGGWHSFKAKGADLASLGLDSRGRVHAMSVSTAGVKIRRWSLARGWTRPTQVAAAVDDHAVHSSLVVQPDGTEYVAMSAPSQTFTYPGGAQMTQFTVLKRSAGTVSYTPVWHQDGVPAVDMVADRHGVRLAWSQFSQADSQGVPQEQSLLTQALPGGSPTTLTSVGGSGEVAVNTWIGDALAPQTARPTVAWETGPNGPYDQVQPQGPMSVLHAGVTTTYQVAGSDGLSGFSVPASLSGDWLAYSAPAGVSGADGTVVVTPLPSGLD